MSAPRASRRPSARDLLELDRLVDGGILFFRPTYVRRLYMDGGRMSGGEIGGTRLSGSAMWRPERWIASTVAASNPSPLRGEGLSRLEFPALRRVTFRDALAWRGSRILGDAHLPAVGPAFPVLIKVLDPGEPIVFHFHASDVDVADHPRRFPGQRWGKDEAYYFLPAPRGAVPYAHIGLSPGVTPMILAEAIARGTALDLSPVLHQRIGEGLHVPAGVPHRPGTALTLEIQQPSDVYTLLEHRWGDRPLAKQEMHPGFARLAEALRLIDYEAAADPKLLERHRLVPEPVVDTRTRGGEEAWIFPPRLRKFSGKRVIVRTRFESREAGAYVLLVWQGHGRVLGRRVRPGVEALVTAEAARRPHLFEADGGPLELFKLFPPSPRPASEIGQTSGG